MWENLPWDLSDLGEVVLSKGRAWLADTFPLPDAGAFLNVDTLSLPSVGLAVGLGLFLGCLSFWCLTLTTEDPVPAREAKEADPSADPSTDPSADPLAPLAWHHHLNFWIQELTYAHTRLENEPETELGELIYNRQKGVVVRLERLLDAMHQVQSDASL
jgi:hypothetical protein